MRIIDKTGPLHNPADRDHCLQYMVAVPLIHGRLTAADYEDEVARDPRIDALRARMEVRENPAFTTDYYAPDKRFIGNAIQVFYKDGTRTERIEVDTPIGHRRRRAEGYPVLVDKFRASLPPVFPENSVSASKRCSPTRRVWMRWRWTISSRTWCATDLPQPASQSPKIVSWPASTARPRRPARPAAFLRPRPGGLAPASPAI